MILCTLLLTSLHPKHKVFITTEFMYRQNNAHAEKVLVFKINCMLHIYNIKSNRKAMYTV